jgi:hypothetical protein
MRFALALIAAMVVAYAAANVVANAMVAVEPSPLDSASGHCWCQHTNCSCCADLAFKVKGHHFNETACVLIGYDAAALEVLIEVTLNGKVVWKDVKSAENPNFCFKIPVAVLEALGVQLCLDFENLVVSHKHFSGCLDLSVKWDFGTVVKPFRVDCFNITA